MERIKRGDTVEVISGKDAAAARREGRTVRGTVNRVVRGYKIDRTLLDRLVSSDCMKTFFPKHLARSGYMLYSRETIIVLPVVLSKGCSRNP